jgi:hypothetical protein
MTTTTTRCPVCKGSTNVAGYNCNAQVISTSCKSCNGSGRVDATKLATLAAAATAALTYAAEELAWALANRPNDAEHWQRAVRRETKFLASL